MATLPVAWVRGCRRPRGGHRIAAQLVARVWFAGRGWWFAVICLGITTLLIKDAVVWTADYDRLAEGRVTHVAAWGNADRERLYRVDFAFTDAAGAERIGRSYTSDPPWTGELRDVEYVRTDPETSRMLGMSRRPIGALTGVAALLASVAMLSWLAMRLWRGANITRLLRTGTVVRARIVARERVRRCCKQCWRLQLALPGGESRVVVVDQPVTDTDPTVLYDPTAAHRTLVLEALPGRPQVEGDTIAADGYALPLYLVAPALVVVLIVAELAALAG